MTIELNVFAAICFTAIFATALICFRMGLRKGAKLEREAVIRLAEAWIIDIRITSATLCDFHMALSNRDHLAPLITDTESYKAQLARWSHNG